MTTTVTTTTSELLADPAQVALIRDLYAHARNVRAEHATYSYGNGRGQAMAPVEHTWTVGSDRVSYEDGELRFLSCGVPLLKVHTVNVRQAAQLLAAIGVLPQRFTAGGAVQPKSEPDPRRVAYDLVLAGVAAGLPIPNAINIPSGYDIFELKMADGDQASADAWAAYLNLPTPSPGSVVQGNHRDFRNYGSEGWEHPAMPGWKVEVSCYVDEPTDGGAR